jgi:hypothetical protein
MHRFSLFSLLTLSAATACDFDQLHNPAASTTGAAGGTDSTTAATDTTSTGAGGADTTATTSTTADTTATTADTTATTGGSGGSGTGGATGTGGAKADASGGGTGIGDASSDGALCAGYALSFNGTSTYATLNRPVQDDFTLEAWIKPSAALPLLSGTNIWNGYGIIYADMNTTTNDFGASLVNGKFAFGVGNPDTNVQSATLIANGQWTHVAATRAMATGVIQVFVNGSPDGMVTTTQKASLNAPPIITLGADVLDKHFFSGLIDEVRLWNVARQPADIVATMHQRLAGNEPGLVGYFRFDEGTGTTAADGSPTKGNATLGGADGGAGAVPAWVMSDAPICP